MRLIGSTARDATGGHHGARDAAVVFIPGFMQPGDAWAAVAERLRTLSERRCSTTASTPSRAACGEIAAAGEGALLVGYSLGGRLALRAALRDPARYAGLVTVGATAGIEEPADARGAGRGRRAARLVDGGRADRGHRRPSGSASRCSPTSPRR